MQPMKQTLKVPGKACSRDIGATVSCSLFSSPSCLQQGTWICNTLHGLNILQACSSRYSMDVEHKGVGGEKKKIHWKHD